MNRQDFVKGQVCVLKVNVDCDGCKQKVKKLLRKIDGVYDSSIDIERGMVTVKGSVDPATLIKKLEKSGKHAELWGPQKGSNNFPNQMNNQFKNMQIDFGKGGKDNKAHKGGGNNMPKGGQQQFPQQQQFMKAQNNMMMMQGNNNSKKSVKFDMHEDDLHDSEDDEFDDDEYDEDDFSDEDDDFGGHHHNLPPNKMMQGKGGGGGGGGHGHGHGGIPNKMNGFAMNDKKSYGGGMDGKKGGVIDIPVGMKGMGGGKDGKNGGGGGGKKGHGGNDKGSKNSYGDKDKKKSSKSGGGFLGGLLGGGKSKKKDKSKNEYGGKNGANKGGNHGGKGGSKKGSFLDIDDMNDGFHGMDIPHHGKDKGKGKGGGGKKPGQMGGGNPMGGNHSMGQMGNYPMGQMPAVHGLPASAAMNGGGYYQGPGMNNMNMGMGPGNPYGQQYMPPPMMMNQQRPSGYDMYQPMMYARPPPSVNYMPPMPQPAPDPYSHYFSDENPTGCSIM